MIKPDSGLSKSLEIVFLRPFRYYAEAYGFQRKTKILYSSPKTFNDNQVTILAIIETIILFFISLALILDGVFIHVALGLIFAPMLLLRTDNSVKLGLLTLDKLTLKLRNFFLKFDISERQVLYLSPLSLILLPLIVLISRCYSIVVQIVLNPLDCIKSIPRNWKKQVLCIDFAHPPEPVPGIESIDYQGEWSDLKFSSFDFYQETSNLHFIYTVFLLFLVYFPSLIYRWSLKSTALLYSPLLWLINYTFPGNLNLKNQLTSIRKSDTSIITLIYSSVILICFSLKIYLMSFFYEKLTHLSEGPLKHIELIVAPEIIPRWQLALVISSIISWILFLYAGNQLRLMDNEGGCISGCVKNCLSQCPRKWHFGSLTLKISFFIHSMLFTKGILAIYVILVNWYFLVQSYDKCNLPPLGTKWFPW